MGEYLRIFVHLYTTHISPWGTGELFSVEEYLRPLFSYIHTTHLCVGSRGFISSWEIIVLLYTTHRSPFGEQGNHSQGWGISGDLHSSTECLYHTHTVSSRGKMELIWGKYLVVSVLLYHQHIYPLSRWEIISKSGGITTHISSPRQNVYFPQWEVSGVSFLPYTCIHISHLGQQGNYSQWGNTMELLSFYIRHKFQQLTWLAVLCWPCSLACPLLPCSQMVTTLLTCSHVISPLLPCSYTYNPLPLCYLMVSPLLSCSHMISPLRPCCYIVSFLLPWSHKLDLFCHVAIW